MASALKKLWGKSAAPEKRTVVVLGASGKQGSSVVEALLRDEGWNIRGMVKHKNSEIAKDLSKRGVDIYEHDLQGNFKNLEKALKGAYAIFCVTMPSMHLDHKISEFEEGKMIADLAKKHGIQHFILSSLPNVEKESSGKYNVPHFTDKAKLEEYVRTLGFKNTAFVMPAFYFENFLEQQMAPRIENGEFIFSLPVSGRSKFCAVDISDIGLVVCDILNSPTRFDGMQIPITGEISTLDDMIATFSKVTGHKARYEQLNSEKGGQMPVEYLNMFKWMNDYGYYGSMKDINTGKKFFQLCSFERFLRQPIIQQRFGALKQGKTEHKSHQHEKAKHTGMQKQELPKGGLNEQQEIEHQKQLKSEVNKEIVQQHDIVDHQKQLKSEVNKEILQQHDIVDHQKQLKSEVNKEILQQHDIVDHQKQLKSEVNKEIKSHDPKANLTHVTESQIH